jgi:ferredoxin
MERLGVDHPWSCREGLCGTCEAPVLEGEVEHLDTCSARPTTQRTSA